MENQLTRSPNGDRDGATPPETPQRGVKRGLGGTSPSQQSSNVTMPSAANHTLSMLQNTEAASILSPAGHQRVLHGFQTMLNDSNTEIDRYKNIIEQLDVERKKLKADKDSQELINKKLAEDMAALQRQRPDTTKIREHLKNELVADYNIRFQTLKEEEELKRQNLIATISAEFDTKAERFREETALKHQQELVLFQREQLQHQSDHNKQLEDIAAVVKTLQAESAAKDKELDELRLKNSQSELTKVKPSSPKAGSNLEYLRRNIFNYVPPTVNTNRGGAVQLGDTINYSETAYETPLHPKKVHFSSTPLVVNNDDREVLGSQSTEIETTAASILQNTALTVAKELKHIRQPKLTILKGGCSQSAVLRYKGWLADARQIVSDRELNQTESIQLLKDHSEGRIHQQIEFYLATTKYPAFAGLCEHLDINFGSAEDEASLKQEFYSRTQTTKETADDFADSLQTLARKVLSVNDDFQKEVENALKVQFANGLKDLSHQVQARGMLLANPTIPFVKFKMELGRILGTRSRKPVKAVTTSTIDNDSDEENEPSAKRVKKEDKSDLEAQIAQVLKENRLLREKMDNFDPNNLAEVVIQHVEQRRPTYGPGIGRGAPQQGAKPIYGKPYLGPDHPPVATKGVDGSLQLTDTCAYCKNPGHLKQKCTKLHQKIRKQGNDPYKELGLTGN